MSKGRVFALVTASAAALLLWVLFALPRQDAPFMPGRTAAGNEPIPGDAGSPVKQEPKPSAQRARDMTTMAAASRNDPTRVLLAGDSLDPEAVWRLSSSQVFADLARRMAMAQDQTDLERQHGVSRSITHNLAATGAAAQLQTLVCQAGICIGEVASATSADEAILASLTTPGATDAAQIGAIVFAPADINGDARFTRFAFGTGARARSIAVPPMR